MKLSQLPRVPNSNLNVALEGFRELSFLRELNASGFTLGCSIPDWLFTSLTSLQLLDFTGSSLFGGIPWNFPFSSNLTYLSLARNNLSGDIPATLGRFRNLTALNLSVNKLTGSLPEFLFNATGLMAVDLSYNNLTGEVPSAIANLVNLKLLFGSHNEFTGSLPPEIGSLPALTQLEFSSNFFSGAIPAEVSQLKNLVSLSLADNNISGTFPSFITNCTNLKTLNLRENVMRGFLPESVGQLRNLETLDVSSNRVTGVLPTALLTLVSLQTLDIAHNYFYGPILDLENVQFLNVSFNFFNGSVPAGLVSRAAVKKNCLSGAPGQHAFHTCVKFYARQRVIFGPPSIPPSVAPAEQPQEPSTATPKGSKLNHLVPVLSGVLGGVGLIVLVGSLVFCIHRCLQKKSRRGSGRTNGSIGGSLRMGSARGAVSAMPTGRMGEVFTYAQLQQATKNFSMGNLISNGHSGDLYRGLLDSGALVAVKRIDLTKVKMETYLQELEVLGRASHTRLVLLLGHCLDGDDEKFLVYKFTPNGDLASALHMKGSPGPCEDVLQSLDWITRLKIAIGVAEALSYLHSECSPPIVHRDVKASSILLDDKFEVRLGSLSDARVQDGDPHPSRITRLLGLSQSSDQGDSGAAVSTSADVYNFGKVLLELVSGKLGISGSMPDPRSEVWLEWALPLISVHDKESLPKLVDPSLIVDEDLLEEVWAMAIIARACLHTKPHKRPSMRHVLKALENPHKVVREENFGESLAVRTSSHSSWNEALFGSWRHNHNNTGHMLSMAGLREVDSSFRHGSSLPVAKVTGNASSSAPGHTRRGSSDIAPEPIDEESGLGIH